MLAAVVVGLLPEDPLDIELGNLGPVGVRDVLAELVAPHTLLTAPVTAGYIASLALLDKRNALSWSRLGHPLLGGARALETCQQPLGC